MLYIEGKLGGITRGSTLLFVPDALRSATRVEVYGIGRSAPIAQDLNYHPSVTF